MFQIQIPEKVNTIITTLTAAGHEAFAVGGCVRDAVLGRKPADWDITTSASPFEVKALFDRTIDTGLQHGTVTIMMGKEGFEVTTYRVDGEYEDGRHPKEVTFTKSLLEDLKRRDFTINAMAYNHESGLVDAFDGMGDLKRGVIRCVGDPVERFTEDALRMMRAVRFSAQLGFTIEEDTRRAITLLKENLRKVSAERIQVELVKLLVSAHPEQMRDLYETGLTSIFMPEFDACMACEQNNPHHIYTVGEHTIHALMAVEADKVLRLTMLFHDFGKPGTRTTDEEGIHHFYRHQLLSEEMASAILRRLKFDNDTILQVKKLARFHDTHPELTPSSVRRAANRIGADLFPYYLKVYRADVMAQNPATWEEKLTGIAKVEEIYQEILEKEECFTLKQLAVTGRDLIQAGMKPGPELGRILEALLEKVLEDPTLNRKEWLLEEAARIRQMPEGEEEQGECNV